MKKLIIALISIVSLFTAFAGSVVSQANFFDPGSFIKQNKNNFVYTQAALKKSRSNYRFTLNNKESKIISFIIKFESNNPKNCENKTISNRDFANQSVTGRKEVRLNVKGRCTYDIDVLARSDKGVWYTDKKQIKF